MDTFDFLAVGMRVLPPAAITQSNIDMFREAEKQQQVERGGLREALLEAGLPVNIKYRLHLYLGLRTYYSTVVEGA